MDLVEGVDLVEQVDGCGQHVDHGHAPGVQRAAEEAVGGLGKSASIVAIDPGTGRVLAVADSPDSGESHALTGRFPPGSTFKTVTAAALLDGGLTAGDRVGCPAAAHVAGQRFENQDEFDLPPGTTFAEAFARSCNTTFATVGAGLAPDGLTSAALQLGLGADYAVPAVTTITGAKPVSMTSVLNSIRPNLAITRISGVRAAIAAAMPVSRETCAFHASASLGSSYTSS